MNGRLMQRTFLVAAAGVVIAAGCSSTPPAAAGPTGGGPDAASDVRNAPLDDTLHVALGRNASADGGRLVVTFAARLSDSRCPANALCVWMGDAALRVSARVGGTTVERDLHTGVEPHSLSIDGYVVTVVGLTPYPGTEDRSTPTAILRVVRR